MGLAATALMCLAISPACAGPAAVETPSPVAAFTISYERSGGLKPLPQKLVVRPGRHAVAASAGTRAGEQEARFRISRKAVLRLQERLAAAEFTEIESPLPGNCADCYLYSIRYLGHRVLFDQSATPARLDGVVREIESIIYAHTIPPNAEAERRLIGPSTAGRASRRRR